MTIELLLFLTSLGLSVLFNWIMINFSINLGSRDTSNADEIRWQSRKPSVGGISFFVIFLILNSILTEFKSSLSLQEINRNHELGILLSATFGFFIGLIDDARNTNPILKFLGQIVCACILIQFGIMIHLTPNFFWNSLVTIVWVVFLMNSINMLDNMDGLTSLISILIFMSLIFFNAQNDMLNNRIIVLIGVVLGFLFFNWYPSKIYMGDSGSQFLGIVLASLSILVFWNERTDFGGYFQLNQFFIPLFAFTIPIFDTSTVFLHRILRRQSPFVGGKDHLSHHIVYLGCKDSSAVYILGFIQFSFLFLAINSVWIQRYFENFYIVAFGFWVLSFILVQYFYIKSQKYHDDRISSSSF